MMPLPAYENLSPPLGDRSLKTTCPKRPGTTKFRPTGTAANRLNTNAFTCPQIPRDRWGQANSVYLSPFPHPLRGAENRHLGQHPHTEENRDSETSRKHLLQMWPAHNHHPRLHHPNLGPHPHPTSRCNLGRFPLPPRPRHHHQRPTMARPHCPHPPRPPQQIRHQHVAHRTPLPPPTHPRSRKPHHPHPTHRRD